MKNFKYHQARKITVKLLCCIWAGIFHRLWCGTSFLQPRWNVPSPWCDAVGTIYAEADAEGDALKGGRMTSSLDVRLVWSLANGVANDETAAGANLFRVHKAARSTV